MSRKRESFSYTVMADNKVDKVCKKAFLNIHGLSAKRVRVAIRKQSKQGVLEKDCRGKHVPANKAGEIQLARVKEHIEMLPKFASHYSRVHSPNKLFLAPGAINSVRSLHQAYNVWMYDNYPNECIVSLDYYRRIFTTQYNIGFSQPKSDTCTTCDKYKMFLQNTNDEELKTSTLQSLQSHKSLASEARRLMNSFKTDDDPSVLAICVDLQQTLSTPKLSSGISYYKRKLWTYNLSISNLKTNQPTMYVWDELTAKRGSIEVASCIHHWIKQNTNDRVTNLYVFSDNCAEQNKNKNLVLMYLREIHQSSLIHIEQIYLISGHSTMPCDSQFGQIEQNIKRQYNNIIYTINDYIKAIATAVSERFSVVKMKQPDFLNFDELQKFVVNRKCKDVKFMDARKLIFDHEYQEGYVIQTEYQANSINKHHIRLQKGRKPFSSSIFNLANQLLVPKYCDILPITQEKKKDINELIELMPSFAKSYYKSILYQIEVQNDKINDAAVDETDDIMDYIP